LIVCYDLLIVMTCWLFVWLVDCLLWLVDCLLWLGCFLSEALAEGSGTDVLHNITYPALFTWWWSSRRTISCVS